MSEKAPSKTKRPEVARFLEYYRVYAQATPKISGGMMAQAKSTNSAKAVSTQSGKQVTNGPKGITDAGVQSIKDAGKQRTQANQPKR